MTKANRLLLHTGTVLWCLLIGYQKCTV